AALSPIIGTALAGLRADRHDQAAYAAHARVIAREVAALLLASDRADAEAPSDSEPEDGRSVFGLLADTERDVAEHHAAVAVADADRSRDLDALRGAYRVFTTDYDVEAAATSLVRPALLKALRERLDSRIAALGINIHRLARELQALLADPV